MDNCGTRLMRRTKLSSCRRTREICACRSGIEGGRLRNQKPEAHVRNACVAVAVARDHLSVGRLGTAIQDHCGTHFTVDEPGAVSARPSAADDLDAVLEEPAPGCFATERRRLRFDYGCFGWHWQHSVYRSDGRGWEGGGGRAIRGPRAAGDRDSGAGVAERIDHAYASGGPRARVARALLVEPIKHAGLDLVGHDRARVLRRYRRYAKAQHQ